ncbi:ABC transporter substrate-binding protein [Arthrobacter cryoconiti]|uniref:ABC transporter substrate-binding protein n=1 Tax=Arthrobacter cryoconiti TaxID=748907 RepID=A0ABV8QXG9_9MICC|nr:ABC transporter substrate-binding protein [Arthrobacter cryoconiti]MCC9067610.1 ABC transporter substrate-binding protein [Arthrobacter cryoconiti]
MNKRLVPVAAFAAAALVALSGCAPSAAPAPSESGSAQALTIENCGTEQTFTQVPSRVVLLGGASVAEVNSFIALGIADSIIANLEVYGASDDPSLVGKVAALPTGGLTVNENYGPPAEQLLAQHPDLVVSSYAGGFDASLGFATRDEISSFGAKTLITPANCANGNPNATDKERQRYDTAGIDGSYELLRTLGRIFRVEEKAESVISGMEGQLASVSTAIKGSTLVSGIILSPGFGTDVPTAWTGGIFDDVLKQAGVTNVFAGRPAESAGTFSAEQLLVSEPATVVLFGDGTVDIAALRASIEKQFPHWPAVKSQSFVTVHDGVYLGPTNAIAVENIAHIAHPDAF